LRIIFAPGNNYLKSSQLALGKIYNFIKSGLYWNGDIPLHLSYESQRLKIIRWNQNWLLQNDFCEPLIFTHKDGRNLIVSYGITECCKNMTNQVVNCQCKNTCTSIHWSQWTYQTFDYVGQHGPEIYPVFILTCSDQNCIFFNFSQRKQNLTLATFTFIPLFIS
jgi:hypothetical protein